MVGVGAKAAWEEDIDIVERIFWEVPSCQTAGDFSECSGRRHGWILSVFAHRDCCFEVEK